MDILERIRFISQIAFDFNIDNYLAKEAKSILVFKIDTNNKSYSLLLGNDVDNILDCANAKFIDSLAGYKVNVHEIFEKQTPADLFLIADVIINSNPSHIDTIIIHEIVHLIIDSGNSQTITILPFIKEMALRLLYATDIENIERTKHDEEFCMFLIYGCANYQSKTKNYRNLQETVENAMRYDTFRKFSLTD